MNFLRFVDLFVLIAAENSLRSIEGICTHRHIYTPLGTMKGELLQSNLAILETGLGLPHAVFKYHGIPVIFTPVSARTSLSFPFPDLHWVINLRLKTK